MTTFQHSSIPHSRRLRLSDQIRHCYALSQITESANEPQAHKEATSNSQPADDSTGDTYSRLLFSVLYSTQGRRLLPLYCPVPVPSHVHKAEDRSESGW